MVEVIKGTDTLQQVTDVGATTNNNIIILSSKQLILTPTNNSTAVDEVFTIQNDSAIGRGLLLKAGTTGLQCRYHTTGLSIGSITIDTNCLLQLNSTARGFASPRMTTAQKNAIANPIEGLEVYDLTLHKKCVYNGSAWEVITSL